MLKTVKSIALAGIDPVPVTVECEVMNDGIGIHLIGLSDAAVKESLLRTVTAMQASGYHIPGRKVVINIAPADVKKSGCSYDLPILLSMLAASGMENLPNLEKWIVVGEIGLDASVRSVDGCVQAVQAALDGVSDIMGVIIPYGNIEEVAPLYMNSANVYGVKTLSDAIGVINGTADVRTAWEEYLEMPERHNPYEDTLEPAWGILAPGIRRAVEIAAAGGHNVIFIGAPGSGKASAAKALYNLLPRISVEEEEVVAAIYSAARGSYPQRVGQKVHTRPFRAPHVTASLSACLGGGTGDRILPGEVSLAHKGVLFLDEMAEAPKALMEALRGPVEDKKVTISRLKSKVDIPADFQLVLASNPCPCGYYGEGERCTCTPAQRAAYMARLSGPLMDNVAMQVWCHQIQYTERHTEAESMDLVRTRVEHALYLQKQRYQAEGFSVNDRIPADLMDKYCLLGENEKTLLENLIVRLGLSARAYSRILRIARTIADLDGKEMIEKQHISEAASYRFLDRMSI